MARRPWMKWYPSDWRADPKLRMCSLAARGLWADMLSLMHEAEPYGHLRVSGISPTDRQLAALIGAQPKEITTLLRELEDADVFSREADGTIYSRRMVRDKAKEDRDRENGKGGGNPKLREPDNAGVNPPDKAHMPEARSQKPVSSEAKASSDRAPALPLNAPKASRLPVGWRPSDDVTAWARREYPRVNLKLETDKFADYWHAKSGSGATKTDWDATWRNWIRTAGERLGDGPPTAAKPGVGEHRIRGGERVVV